jgi:hypothetical protein
MKKKISGMLSCILVLVSTGTLIGVELEKPTANLTEKFGTASGWTASADAGVVAGWTTNENLSVQYPGRSPSAYDVEKAELKGGAGASSGIFSGDLSKMETISFYVNIQDLAARPAVYFISQSGTKWLIYYDVPSGSSAGWVNVTVPLVFDANMLKCRSIPEGKTQADFSSDLTSVTEVGFRTSRDGNHNYAQAIAVDDVKLIGPWSTNLVDGVPLAWALEYGITNGLDPVGISDPDADHDGFTNIAEFLAGTDPSNSSSFFRIDIARDQLGKVVVKWNDNKYMKFTLLESDNLVTFTEVEGARNIMGVGTQRVVQVENADVVGARFYKVKISQ